MSIFRLIQREIAHRKLSFALGVFSVMAAAAALVAPQSLLRVYDRRTESLLEQKTSELKERLKDIDDQIRRTMLKLGFNLVILPKEQDTGEWYSDGEGSCTMPEEYARKLAQSDLMTVQHMLPSLQRRITWPETGRNIILVGTKGEEPRGNISLKSLQNPVNPGEAVLGYELSRSLKLKAGDELTLMGRRFRISKSYDERGNRDDITIWLNLADAQSLLGEPGRINAIMALQCNCPNSDLESIRKQVAGILPGTRVIERRSKALARAEARAEVKRRGRREIEEARLRREELRAERERLAAVMAPLAMLVCALWIGIGAFMNVRGRRSEIGVLRAFGFRSSQVAALFLWRAFIMGVAGAVPGILLGGASGSLLERGSGNGFIWTAGAGAVLPALLAACLLPVIASWIPALLAARQDPAEVLREE